MIRLAEEVRAALADRRHVVALESTLIAHGLPWPVNVETASEAEKVVRDAGAIPATIAILDGVPTVGLSPDEILHLAQSADVRKASRRDIGLAVALGQTAATTVAATMAIAHLAGISVFATGGIGGVHPDPFDVSADLLELARTPVLVVCAGAKSILDLPKTLEVLETQGVPVVGYRTADFPAFYVRSSGLPIPRVESPADAAQVFAAHRQFGGGSGMVLAQPVADGVAIDETAFADALRRAERKATGLRGATVTPFLLARLAEETAGATLVANRALIVANARLAAEVMAQL